MKVIESIEAKKAIYTNMFILVNNKLHQISIPGKRHNHFKFIYVNITYKKVLIKL